MCIQLIYVKVAFECKKLTRFKWTSGEVNYTSPEKIKNVIKKERKTEREKERKKEKWMNQWKMKSMKILKIDWIYN